MSIVFALTALAPIVLKPSTHEELANSLARQVKAPVAIFVNPKIRKWPGATIDRDRLAAKDVNRLLRTKLGTAEFPVETFGLATPAWPDFFMSFANRAIYFRECDEIIGKGTLEWRRQGGQVSVRTRDGAVPLDEVLAKFIDKVSAHPFFKGARVVLAAENKAESDVLAAVAVAMGGKPVKVQGGWNLQVDVNAYRARGLAYFKKQELVDHPVFAARARFSTIALHRIPDVVLEKMLSSENGQPIQWNDAPAEVAVAANKCVWEVMTNSNGPGSGERQIETWKKDYDMSRPVVLVGGGGFGFAYPHHRLPGAFLKIL